MATTGAGTGPQEGGARRRRWSFPIGRVLGIPLRVHVTFLLIVVLFWAGSTAPGGLGLASGMLWLVLIFASVTVHELSHSVVARSRGIGVAGIVLLPIGGVSEMEDLPEDPADEFAVAVVGPLASIVLAAGAALAALATGAPLVPPDLTGGALLPRLAWFNVLVGLFNLLPAFPLDGGRVLRALLERRHDLERATRLAASAGRSLAVAMAVVGVFFDPWLLVIGIFVYFGASAEEAGTVVHARLAGLRVRDVMVAEPIVVEASTPLWQVSVEARHTFQRSFPVVDGGRYVGMIPEAALAEPRTRLAGDVADAGVPVLAPDQELEGDALPVATRSDSRALPVLEGDEVVGLLAVEDLERLLRRGSPPAPRGSRA